MTTLTEAAPAAPPLNSLAIELERQLSTKRDLIADTRNVSFAIEGMGEPILSVDLDGGAEGFRVNRHAHTQIAETVGLPLKVYDRLLDRHPGLFEHLVNGLLSREHETRMVRILDGHVRALLSDKYRRRDNIDLLEHLLPVLAEYPGLQFHRCDLTETKLYVKTFLPGTAREVAEIGDEVEFGVIITNSEVGSGALGVYPYSHRLWCKNGAVHTDFGQRRIHVGKRIDDTDGAYELYSDETIRLDDDAYFAKCADTVRAIMTETVFDSIIAQMRDLAGVPVEAAPPAAVKELAKRHGFTQDEEGSILTHLTQGGDLSGWGYVNAITRHARDLESADRQTELESLAGRLIGDPAWARDLAAA